MDDLERFRNWQENPCSETLVALLEALQRSVYSLCFRVLKHHHDAEDAAQRVLLELLGVLRTFGSLDGMRGWIYRASLLTALSQKRSQRRRRRHEMAPRNLPEPVASEEEGDLIHRHIAELREDLRRVVVEHYFEQRTLAELSAQAHCSTGAIWKKLQKAQDELRLSLARAGIPGGAILILACLETREAGASQATGLPRAVLEKARALTSGSLPGPLGAGGALLKAAAGAALAIGVFLGFLAYHHRDSLETAERPSPAPLSSRSRLVTPSGAAPASAAGKAQPLPAGVAVPPENPGAQSLLERLLKLRLTLEVSVPKKSFGSYIREREALRPLLLAEPDTYITFLQMPESREYFTLFLELLLNPDQNLSGSPLPEAPRAITRGLAEILRTGTRDRKLKILDRVPHLTISFRPDQLVEDFRPPCLEMVAGPDEDLRVHGLSFLMAHGHQDRLDLVQSVWQQSKRFENRLSCINLLMENPSAPAGELLFQYLEETTKDKDPKWMGHLWMTLRDRLERPATPKDQDRCMPLLRLCLQQETRPDEFQCPLYVVSLLPARKQAIVLRGILGQAPSAGINDRILRTLGKIDEGEADPVVLREMLMSGGHSASPPVAQAPAAPSSSPPAEAEAPAPEGPPPGAAPSSDKPVPESFEILSQDGRLKATVKKGADGSSSEFQIWDLEKDDRLLKGWSAFQITAFALSSDGKRYAMANVEGTVSVRSIMGGSAECSLKSHGPVKSLSFSRDGRTLQAPGEAWPIPSR